MIYMYEIKGYFFLKNEEEKIDTYIFGPGNKVPNREYAHDIITRSGIEHYLIILKEI